MAARKHVQVPGHRNPGEILAEARKQGVLNIKPTSLTAAFREGRIKADRVVRKGKFTTYLVLENRVPEIIANAPRSRSSRTPGFIRPEDIIAEAKKRGITDLSRPGFERAVQEKRIRSDRKDPGYRGGHLFLADRMDELIRSFPRKRQEPQGGAVTTYMMLERARRINPKINLSHIQQLLKKLEGAYSLRNAWRQVRTEHHGKLKRVFYPEEIGSRVLEQIKQGRLKGLFVGYGRKEEQAPAPKPVPKPVVSRGRGKGPDIKAVYARMGVSEKQFGIAVHNMRLLLPGSGFEMVEGDLARHIRLSPQQMEKLIREGALKATVRGTIETASVRKLFKPFL